MSDIVSEFDAKKFASEHVPGIITCMNTYGIWHVTATDYMGTKDYGIWKGYIDEIALTIQSNYTALNFEHCEIQVPSSDEERRNATCKINIDFDDPYQIYFDDKVKVYEEIFKNRPVVVGENGGCISIRSLLSEEEEKELKRQKALAKLSDEEKEILGLN